ncbi:hypothetical protein LINJ.12.0667 [Leishmania infantum JPCM5]|uniref:Uncharacterized protein n=1 Tax=Leishmania infantum TaxID=5671 RepID=E9AGG6_LEIIN|nr:hypothetical protein LINJ.12.0667 [Leishmania infantum JPCM5]CBZ08466.1 hypothetical protein LINJ.12.0667 [Leishmania infantum JPCM5]|eukprot:XP_003392318.1 hypothetical protein LINJ.12.0667 [Leishmania infantum JPCM5]
MYIANRVPCVGVCACISVCAGTCVAPRSLARLPCACHSLWARWRRAPGGGRAESGRRPFPISVFRYFSVSYSREQTKAARPRGPDPRRGRGKCVVVTPMTMGVVARTVRGGCRDGGVQRGPLDMRACRLSPPLLLSLPAQTSSLSACPPPPPRLSPVHCLPGCVRVRVSVCARGTTHSQGGQHRRPHCACCHMRPWRLRACAHTDGEGRRDSTHRWSCALCCEALVSVPSLPCRRNRAATTAATLPRRTVPPDRPWA